MCHSSEGVKGIFDNWEQYCMSPRKSILHRYKDIQVRALYDINVSSYGSISTLTSLVHSLVSHTSYSQRFPLVNISMGFNFRFLRAYKVGG